MSHSEPPQIAEIVEQINRLRSEAVQSKETKSELQQLRWALVENLARGRRADSDPAQN